MCVLTVCVFSPVCVCVCPCVWKCIQTSFTRANEDLRTWDLSPGSELLSPVLPVTPARAPAERCTLRSPPDLTHPSLGKERRGEEEEERGQRGRNAGGERRRAGGGMERRRGEQEEERKGRAG